MNRLASVLLITVLTVSVASETVTIVSRNETESRQVLTLEFAVDATPGCALEVVFDYRHILRVSDTVDEVALLEGSAGRQLVRYRSHGFLRQYEAVYERWLVPRQNRLCFRLISYHKTATPIPGPTHSSGHYQVDAIPEGSRVRLSQEVGIKPSPLSRAYFNRVLSETVKFAENLAGLIDERCHLHKAQEPTRYE